MIPDSFYWQEVDRALRPMTGLAAVLAAALGAVLTLTGATPPASASTPISPSCQRCWLQMQPATLSIARAPADTSTDSP